MKIKLLLVPGIWSLLILFSSSCQQSSIKEAKAKEITPPVEMVSQETGSTVSTYSIEEKKLQKILKRSKGLSDLTLEVRFPIIVGEMKSIFIDSLNTVFEKKAANKLQEMKDPENLEVMLWQVDSGSNSTRYTYNLLNGNIWQGNVLNIVQEDYIITNEEQDLGMEVYECYSYSLPSGRLLTTEEVFKAEFAQVLRPRVKKLLEEFGVNDYIIRKELKELKVDVRSLILNEDGSFDYLYGFPVSYGRASYFEIEFSAEEAKILLNI